MRGAEWFSQLEAIEGVGYRSPPGIARDKLSGHDAKPTITEFTYDGKRHTSVMWPLPNGGSTSQSPAGAWPGLKGQVAVGPELLRRLHETLALPGAATDYHFAILTTCGAIWAARREHPELLEDLERFCLLDIRLVETKLQSLRELGGGQMVRVPTFEYLIRLYEREGLYEDALDIAKRGAALEQGEADVTRLEHVVRSLQEEDAG